MADDPVIRGPIHIAISVDDWAKADGAMLTEDDEVVAMMDLNATGVVINLEDARRDQPGRRAMGARLTA